MKNEKYLKKKKKKEKIIDEKKFFQIEGNLIMGNNERNQIKKFDQSNLQSQSNFNRKVKGKIRWKKKKKKKLSVLNQNCHVQF